MCVVITYPFSIYSISNCTIKCSTVHHNHYPHHITHYLLLCCYQEEAEECGSDHTICCDHSTRNNTRATREYFTTRKCSLWTSWAAIQTITASIQYCILGSHGSASLCRDGQKTKWRLQCKY